MCRNQLQIHIPWHSVNVFYIRICGLSVATVKTIHEIIFKDTKCPLGRGGANKKFTLARDSKCTDCWLMPFALGFYPNFEYRLTK